MPAALLGRGYSAQRKGQNHYQCRVLKISSHSAPILSQLRPSYHVK
jgi:hypothetical protein